MSFSKRLLLCLVCALVLSVPARASQTAAGTPHPFCGADFPGEGRLRGVCITGLPDSGHLMLGSRSIRCGDVLPADRLRALTFFPHPSRTAREAGISYLPVFADGPGPEATLTLSLPGCRDEPPVAEDFAVETYKNLPTEGLLKVSDPEHQPMTFTLVRSPRRGEVILRTDGSFVYTPGKNKVGTDSFTFTAADPGGQVSREAAVTVRILKSGADRPYCDTDGKPCRFAAEWLRSAGIFSGETVGGQSCFSPEEPVTRGQFLAMLMQTLKLPVEQRVRETGFSDDAPLWLRPYLAAAQRCGIATGFPGPGGMEFRPGQPIRAGDAAAMVRSAMQFAIPAGLTDDRMLDNWAARAVSAVSGSSGSEILTRSDAARLLCRLNGVNDKEALITAVFRRS